MIQELSIYLTKGDSGALTVRRMDSAGGAVPFLPGDVLYFTVKHFPGCAVTLLQKRMETFEDGEAEVLFSPADTKELEPGVYWYDLQLSDCDGGVTTLAGPAEFILGGDVTDV